MTFYSKFGNIEVLQTSRSTSRYPCFVMSVNRIRNNYYSKGQWAVLCIYFIPSNFPFLIPSILQGVIRFSRFHTVVFPIPYLHALKLMTNYILNNLCILERFKIVCLIIAYPLHFFVFKHALLTDLMVYSLINSWYSYL